MAGKDGNSGRDLTRAISANHRLKPIQADCPAQRARREQLGRSQGN